MARLELNSDDTSVFGSQGSESNGDNLQALKLLSSFLGKSTLHAATSISVSASVIAIFASGSLL